MEKIEISVVIPTYNRKNLVCDSIDSVLSQTYLNYIKEILIVDDGSNDGTEIMIKERYNNELVKYIKKENGGVSTARNMGMRYSTGNWIALLDSDDEWEKNKIELQVKEIEKNPEIDFLGTGWNDITLRIGLKKIDKLYKANVKDLCIKSFPVTPSMLFKKEVYEKTGGFNENQKYAEDSEFCLRVCQEFNYYYLPISLVKTGHGKRSFGESGLSANMKEMYNGSVKNMQALREKKVISVPFFIFLRISKFLNYCRRILVIKIKK